MSERYVIMHGHFYQPPRENPWLEEVEQQPSADPYHDWNERILHECYLPNLVARILAPDGRIRDIVNNYAHMSFNFGPTLLSWIEKKYPLVLEGLVEADRMSRELRGGHGNAIAQAFSHPILPLATERDRETEIEWGISYFWRIFGRRPESLWLPEAAVNAATLRSLMPFGLKYILLAPSQAARVRPLGAGEDQWRSVQDGTIDTRMPYRIFVPDKAGKRDPQRFIDVFFYNGTLSRAIAFDKMLGDAPKLADRFEKAFGDPYFDRRPRVVSVATDGETYGHHEHFGDRGLSFLLKQEFPKRGLTLTNFGEFLEKFPPICEVELAQSEHDEGTAWSCTHGVSRWKSDCGCNAGTPNYHQRWRKPLRDALDHLRNQLDDLYEKEGAPIFRDPWKARNAYIDVFLDRKSDRVESWMRSQLRFPFDDRTKIRALELLEMQRNRLFMYASCGWFFDEISGIEPVQNLRYAARAIQLAKQISSIDLEPELLDGLERAPSNVADYGNGRTVYEKLVHPTVVEWPRIVANFMLTQELVSPGIGSGLVRGNRIELLDVDERGLGPAQLGVFKVSFTSGATGASWLAMGLWLTHSQSDVYCSVAEFHDDADYEALKARLSEIERFPVVGFDEIRHPILTGPVYTLDDLFQEERDRIFDRLMQQETERLREHHESLLRRNLPLLRKYVRSGRPLPPRVLSPVTHALEASLIRLLRDLQTRWALEDLSTVHDIVRTASELGAAFHTDTLSKIVSDLISREAAELERALNDDSVDKLIRLSQLARSIGCKITPYEAQNSLFRTLQLRVLPDLPRARSDRRRLNTYNRVLEAMTEFGFDTSEMKMPTPAMEVIREVQNL